MTEIAHDYTDVVIEKITNSIEHFKPSDFVSDDASWQDRKSGQTRQVILDAAIECLAKVGYTNTSTQLVANTAGVSRGAMLHHYSTKLALIESVSDYINYLRILDYVTEVKKLSEAERVVEGAGIELVWRIMQTPAYAAYIELNFAAMKDPKLAKIFDPKVKKFDNVMIEIMPSVHPEWQNYSKEEMRMAYDVALVTLNGLILSSRIIGDKTRRVKIRNFLFSSIKP